MTVAYFILSILNVFAELTELTYDLGRVTRQHVLPAIVYTYVVTERYVAPAFAIPGNYLMVRRMRLAGVG